MKIIKELNFKIRGLMEPKYYKFIAHKNRYTLGKSMYAAII